MSTFALLADVAAFGIAGAALHAWWRRPAPRPVRVEARSRQRRPR